jgi:hypothetical protein
MTTGIREGGEQVSRPGATGQGEEAAEACCGPQVKASCCEPAEKEACCGGTHAKGCGCR